MSGRSLVEDFTIYWALQSACDGGNVRGLNGAGYTSWRPDLTCTFVENPDTDTSPGQQIISNKLLAYAFILSIEGYPFVYGKDYFASSVWPGAYGLQPWIDNLVWIHEHLANGGTVTQYLDDKVIVLNRTGSPGLLTALNFDTLNARMITCSTSFGPGTQLHDYTGRHDDIRTDAEGRATFTIPSNAFSRGQSYLCFSHSGLNVPNPIVARSTTQTIFGALDLDVGPVRNAQTLVGRITAERGVPITVKVRPDRTNWRTNSALHIVLTDTADRAVIDFICLNDEGVAQGRTLEAGEYSLTLSGSNLPEGGSPFEIDVTYTAPQSI